MWKCKKCGEQIEDNFEACWKCGTGKNGSLPLNQQEFAEREGVQQEIEEQERESRIFENQEKELEKQGKESGAKIQRVQSRYPALHTIAGIFRILAWLVIIPAIVGIIFGFINIKSIGIGVPLLLGSFIGGTVSCVTLFAAAEVIEVLIDIEENTRLTTPGISRRSRK